MIKKLVICFLAACTLISYTACSTMSTTGKGALIGGGGGAALGAGIGALIGKNAKGTIIGAASGAVVGTTVGAVIGKKMQAKKDALAAQLANAQVETTTDDKGYTGLKITFSNGILFNTNSSTLSASAKNELKNFAAQMNGADMANAAIQIYGHTDNTGTAAVNEKLSLQRAQAVSSYLASCGVANARLASKGMSFNDPVASNDTEAGRSQNRRVEVYVLVTDAMVQQYQNQ